MVGSNTEYFWPVDFWYRAFFWCEYIFRKGVLVRKVVLRMGSKGNQTDCNNVKTFFNKIPYHSIESFSILQKISKKRFSVQFTRFHFILWCIFFRGNQTFDLQPDDRCNFIW